MIARKAILAWILVSSLAASAQKPQQPSSPRVPDAESAVKIAEPILVRHYGKRQIDSEKPLKARLEGDVWLVSGTLCFGCVGGVAQMKLRQRDGKVMSVTHTF